MVLAGRCKPNDITATEATILNMQLINTILNFYTENKPKDVIIHNFQKPEYFANQTLPVLNENIMAKIFIGTTSIDDSNFGVQK